MSKSDAIIQSCQVGRDSLTTGTGASWPAGQSWRLQLIDGLVMGEKDNQQPLLATP